MKASLLHRVQLLLKSEAALKDELKRLAWKGVGEPFEEAVFYDHNFISLLETHVSWIGRDRLIKRQRESQKRQFSIRQLDGLWAGKAAYRSYYPDLKSYSHKLKPASEYSHPHRVGYETNADYEHNTTYLLRNKAHIAGTEDGEFHVWHRTWDNRYFLLNIDGAHHIAAIYRQCIEQNRDFMLDCYIEHHILNETICRSLIRGTHYFILHTHCLGALIAVIKALGYGDPFFCECGDEKSLLGLDRTPPQAEKLYWAIKAALPEPSYIEVTAWLARQLSSNGSRC